MSNPLATSNLLKTFMNSLSKLNHRPAVTTINSFLLPYAKIYLYSLYYRSSHNAARLANAGQILLGQDSIIN